MTAPMRRDLLNRQIAIEARKIAHAATKTCCDRRNVDYSSSDFADEHTKNCNRLKEEIEKLVLSVKLASLQPVQRAQPEPLELQQEEDQQHGEPV